MIRTRGRSRLLRKYVVCNLCFVMIPVIILIVLYFNYAANQIIAQYGETQQYALRQAMAGVDENMSDFSLVSTQISMDAYVTPFQLQAADYNTINALSRLKAYYSRTSFLHEMFLYVKGDDTLYSLSLIHILPSPASATIRQLRFRALIKSSSRIFCSSKRRGQRIPPEPSTVT